MTQMEPLDTADWLNSHTAEDPAEAFSRKLRSELILPQILPPNDIVYLDNAATTPRLQCAMDAMMTFTKFANGNPHRGSHHLANEAELEYEHARRTVADFLHADPSEIIFTAGATQSLNLVALCWGAYHLREGDEVITTIMEHHSNELPWRFIANGTMAKHRIMKCDENGFLTDEEINRNITSRTRLVAVTQMSNVFGQRQDKTIARIVRRAHSVGAAVVLDAAQSVSSLDANALNVRKLDVDFLAFSGHKVYAPMGIGVLYAKRERMLEMLPLFLGGGMVNSVTREDYYYAEAPQRFEAGTVNAAGAVALGEALQRLRQLDPDGTLTHAWKQKLTARLFSGLYELAGYGLRIAGSPSPQMHEGLVTFTLDKKTTGLSIDDINLHLSEDGICVRTGLHCAHPLMQHLGMDNSIRVSIGAWNSIAEVDKFIESLHKTVFNYAKGAE